MANIMTKRGNLDNIVTYEHICDTFEDMQNIDPRTATLGSVCIVIKGENDNLEVYIADSNKEWNMLSTNSSGGSDIGIGIHICENDEYDSITGEPTIEEPIENQFYLVPSSGSDSSNLFDEWIYIDENWEKFGSSGTAVTNANWTAASNENGYIDNKPSIEAGSGNRSIEENYHSHTTHTNTYVQQYVDGATGANSHAEGYDTAAIGNYSHAEGTMTIAQGNASHAEGEHTIANSSNQHVSGKYNIPDSVNTYAEIIGNGNSNTPSNARTLDWNGNEWLAGNLTLNQTTLTENKLQYLVGLNINNTLDADKPVSTAQRAAIDAVTTKTVEVTGTDVIIEAVSNTRYICGELSTLDFTPSSTGISDVLFTSGSSKTILTLPNTVKMPDWFEVESNMIYEISIADGVYGVVTSWAI